MNLADIKNRVKRTFGDESGVQLTDTDIVRWANDAQRDIVMQNKSVLEKIQKASVLADIQEYDFPGDLLILRSISYKDTSYTAYFPLQDMNLNEFDECIYGWDEAIAFKGIPTVYTIYAKKIKLFPIPIANVTDALKIYYSKKPVDLAADGDISELPEVYHNALVNYVMQQAFTMDENWEAAGNMASIIQADINQLKGLEKRQPQATYRKITVMPDDAW